MRKKIVNLKDAFVDGFLLARVKFASFIKAHKTLSSFIALFVISSVIAIIAFAQTTVLAKITDVSVTASDIESESSDDVSTFKSFSTMSFNVGYVVGDFEEIEVTTTPPVTTTTPITDDLQANISNISETSDLEAGKVVITGQLYCDLEKIKEQNSNINHCSDLGFSWDQGDQSAVYNIENDKITVSVDNIPKGSHTQKIYLKIGNVSNNSKVTAKFKVNNSEEKTKEITIESTPINEFVPTLYSGPAQKVNSNIRNAIFGLTLSLPQNIESLKGLYINPDYELLLSSSQSGENPLKSEVLTTEDNYGVYKTELKYFNIPNGVYDIYEEHVYDSGQIKYIEKLESVNDYNLYKFKVSNIKTDENILIKDGKIILGSYFLAVKSERENTNTIEVKLKAKIGSNEAEAVINNVNYSSGSKTLTMDIYEEKEDLTSSLVLAETIAYGEDFVAKANFSYSKDADESIRELNIEIPASEQYKIISYGTIGEEIKTYYIDGLTPEANDYKVYYIAKASDGSEVTYESLQVLEESNNSLSKIRLVAKNIAPGTNIDFRLRFMLVAKNHNSNVTVTSIAKYDGETINSTGTSKITAFKIRSNVFIDEIDKDVIIDGANQSSSIISINPILSMPSALINTNIEDVGQVSYVQIKVTLPEGLKFIKTDDSVNQVINNNVATITIKDVKYNEWIEPVEIEVGYNIDIPNNSIKTINVEAQAYSTKGLYDISSIENRTVTRNIKYLNSEVIAYNQYAPVSNVAKNKQFVINTDLKNTTDTIKEFELITLLPHNIMSSEKQYYNGTYKLSNLSEGTLCTKEQGINDLKTYSNWVSCSEYASDGYKDVVAIKNTGNIESQAVTNYSFTLIPSDNSTGDEYHFNSTLLYSNSNDSNKVEKTLRTTTVSVVSKRITGLVWEDFNGDGVRQSEETFVPDVKLNLYLKTDTEDTFITSTQSDSSGKYSFVDLQEGEYFVTAEFDNNKYGLSPMNATSDLSLASRFSQKVLDEESYYKMIWEKYTEYLKKAPLRTLYNKKEEKLTDEVTSDKIIFKLNSDSKILKSTFNYSKGILSYSKISTDDEGLTLLLIADIFDALCNLRGYDYDTLTDWFSKMIENETTFEEKGIYIKLDKGVENNSEYVKISELKIDLTNGIERFEKKDSASNMLGKVIKSVDMKVTPQTKSINNINLGLSLRKIYTVSIKKTISKVVTTTNLGLVTTYNYDNVPLAKLDVKDISNLSIKVIYNIELENTGYYPGYIFKVNDYLPEGMTFNPDDPTNKDWELNEDGHLINRSLSTDLIYGKEKRYLTLALDIARKEAGSFINYASVEDSDLQILGGVSHE